MLLGTPRLEPDSFRLGPPLLAWRWQEQLRDLWQRAQHDHLCAWGQAEALALRRNTQGHSGATSGSCGRSATCVGSKRNAWSHHGGAGGSRGLHAKRELIAADWL